MHVLNTSFGIGPDQCYDIIIFNPPYVPTTPEELALAKQNHDITAAWAGGQDGLEVIYDTNFLEFIPSKLAKPNGAFYLLLIDEN